MFSARAETFISHGAAAWFSESGSNGVIEMQNAWGFGQVLSLALLVLPLANLFGELTGSPTLHYPCLNRPFIKSFR